MKCLFSTVLDTATRSGAAVAPRILELAGTAAGAKSIAFSPSFTTLTLLMRTKATLISAIVIALAAVGTTAYIVSQRDDEPGKEARGGDVSRQAADSDPAGGHDGKVRTREPRFTSLEEAEQALLDFDLTPISGSDREEARRCLLRYRSLTARIPETYYGELARRLGEGADQDLRPLVRQMAIYQEWGRIDFDAALADLPAIEDERRHLKALQSVFFGAADLDPRAAMKMAETRDIEMPGEFGDFERIDLMDTIFDHWIESDPFGAVEWARQAGVPDKRRDQWIADGLRAWTEQDPDAAERWRKQSGFEGFNP